MAEDAVRDIVDTLSTFSEEQLREVQRIVQVLSSGECVNRLHYFARFLGIHWNEGGQCTMTLGTYNENTYKVAQGGALYTFADVAIGFEILKKLRDQEKVFTVEMKMNFLKQGTGKSLSASVDFLHWGRTTVVAQCSIIDTQLKTVAHAVGTFIVVRERET
ncbi:PaaI family thioesterase [Alicyclobacillus fastidiosus]|uniref:PaaI family thioesterase n=1 Tax=Alicyclobacillus fastidiosus TaxID=392011 RepID=A0ABY6ZQ49_9BACL|nr:PaaI family thioesterase [Alicyclobacillus fastidiosus]WAH44075.1 PaaI family thioesterase [Alicyclobacillus fastidiosus]GMA60362.1 hypothetical protein GCM10025859_08020 [Alicyclobacillus fastidiosus]